MISQQRDPRHKLLHSCSLYHTRDEIPMELLKKVCKSQKGKLYI